MSPRLLLLASVAFWATASQAQIATYTFENTRVPTTTDANATATAAVYGPGITGAAFGPGATGQATVASGYGTTGSFNASAQTDYLEATVAAVSGSVLSVSGLTFSVAANASGPSRLVVRTSADGFSTSIGGTINLTGTAFSTQSVTFTGTAFQNRPNLIVRIYGYKSGSSTTGTLSIDDLSIQGTAAVPVTEVATVSFNSASATVTEGGTVTGAIRLGVINDTGTAGLNTAVSGTVSLSVDVSTAVAADVTFTGSFSFPVGAANGALATLSFATVDDAIFEGTEEAAFVIPTVTGASASGQFSLRITDNDPAPALFVNEIDPTGGASDNAEFIEITGPASTALGSFTLVLFDAISSASYFTIDLTGRTLDVSGRFVVGNAGVAGVSVATFPTATIINDRGAVALYQATAASFPVGTNATGVNLVSGIVYGQLGSTDAMLLGQLGLNVQAVEDYAGTAAAQSLGRITMPSGTSRLVYSQTPSPNAANAATVLVDRTADIARGNGYRLLSAPVVKADGALRFNVHDLAQINLVQRVAGGTDAGGTYGPQYNAAPGPNLYLGFNGTAYTPAVTTADDLTPGAGFFWRLYDQNIAPGSNGIYGPGTSQSYAFDNPAFLLRLTGVPLENTPFTVPLAVGFTQNTSGFYLVGNPFAYPLKLTGIAPSTGSFQTTFQAFNGVSYVPVTAGGETAVAPWQGLFAESATLIANGGAFTVGYDARQVLPQARATDLVGRPATTDAPAGLALRLDGTTDAGVTTSDEAALVRVHADASAGWDRHDASKLTPPMATHALVAFVGGRDARRQAVLSLPEGEAPAEALALAFEATAPGTYTLSADLSGLPAGWTARLRDLQTGATADLADGYTFTSDATDWTERFTVALRPEGTTAGESAPAAFRLGAAYPNPSATAARLALRVDTAQRVTAAVVDALGRTVATVFEGALAAGAEQTLLVPTAQLAPGVYVVRVQGETFAGSRRLVVVR